MAMDGDPGVSSETAAPDASVRPPSAERKAAKKAARAEADRARDAKRAAKAERAEARKAERKHERAEAKAARAGRKAARVEQGAVPAAGGPAPAADERSTKKRKRKQRKRSAGRRRDGGPAARARALAARAGTAAAAAGGVLQEVAGLFRQAAEPAAARIVDRVVRPGDPSGGEMRAAHGSEPEPLVAVVQPEPTEPEPLEPEPLEPVVEPEPLEPEPVPAPEAVAEPPEPTQESPLLDFRPSPAPVPPPGPPDVPWPSTDLPAGDLTPTGSAEDVSATPPTDDAPAIVPGVGASVGAAVDIGANSAHLLVAAVSGHRLEPLLDESAFLGLGDRVTRDGFIGADARRELVETLAGYADAARRLGASAITLVGTEPVRRAADAAMLVHEVEARAGVPLHVVDHDEEAMLMLLGVTSGRSVTSELLVVDIGGGSSEFVIAAPGQPVRASGLRLGGAGLTQEHAHSDPPTLAEIDAMRAAARAAIRDAPAAHPAEVIAVGGTASNLLKLLPATAVDRLLTRRRITVALAMLTVERSAEAAERHLLRPQRARVLPAGALIVDAILEHYAVERLRVSDEGVREGAVLASVVGGNAWRDRLRVLVAGWGEAELAAPV